MSQGKRLVRAANGVAQSFIGHLHFWAWLDKRVGTVLSGRPIRHFSSVADFWAAAIADELRSGDRVRLGQVFVSEWVPRVPGQIWLRRYKPLGGRDALEAMRKGMSWTASNGLLDGHTSTIGVIRLPVGNNSAARAALGIISADSWYADLGIPLLVSDSVYDKYLSNRVANNLVEADIDAVLCWGPTATPDPELFAQYCTDQDKKWIQSLLRPIGVPPIFLYVLSPLDFVARSHPSGVNGHLLSIGREERTVQTLYYPSNDDSKELKVSHTPCDPYTLYFYTSMQADLASAESIAASAAGIADGNMGLPAHYFSRVGIRNRELLTEFDSLLPRFLGAVPLGVRASSQPALLPKVRQIVEDLHGAAEDGLLAD